VHLAYNTNGFAHHDPRDAITLLAEIGYRGVGLTIDHGLLSPLSRDHAADVSAIHGLLERHEIRSVIETGARFLLNPQTKHEPTLMTADAAGRARRIEFYRYAIDVARELASDCVSIWSGVLREPLDESAAIERFVEGLRQVCDYAAAKQVTIAFEPEPGMFIDTMARFEQLLDRLGDVPLALTLDIGHLHCQGETPIAAQIRRWRDRLANVHIEDMRRGVHEHLMFGEGEIDFAPVITELKAIDYRGLVQVELSRHSHIALQAARRAFGFLKPMTG
jgi:sugar phosphate isomerase/epimerase